MARFHSGWGEKPAAYRCTASGISCGLPPPTVSGRTSGFGRRVGSGTRWISECDAESVQQVVGLRPQLRRRLEPVGWFGRRTREVDATAWTWTVDGTDLTEWLRQQVVHLEPTVPLQETIWLAGNREDAQERLDRLQGHLPPDFAGQELRCRPVRFAGTCGAARSPPSSDLPATLWRGTNWDGTLNQLNRQERRQIGECRASTAVVRDARSSRPSGGARQWSTGYRCG
jgi:hypothetical protein